MYPISRKSFFFQIYVETNIEISTCFRPYSSISFSGHFYNHRVVYSRWNIYVHFVFFENSLFSLTFTTNMLKRFSTSLTLWTCSCLLNYSKWTLSCLDYLPSSITCITGLFSTSPFSLTIGALISPIKFYFLLSSINTCFEIYM